MDNDRSSAWPWLIVAMGITVLALSAVIVYFSFGVEPPADVRTDP